MADSSESNSEDSAAASVRLAATSPAFVEQATAAELNDWLGYFDPEIVVLTGRESAPRAANALRRHLGAERRLFTPLGQNSANGVARIDGIQFLFVSTIETLADAGSDGSGKLDPDELIYVVNSLLGLDIDRTALSTDLVGMQAYRDALDSLSDSLVSNAVHISTRLPAGYRRTWDGLRVVGGGAEAGYAGTALSAFDCRADGQMLTRELQPTRLGLRALDGVGTKRARTLREAGLSSREAIADTDLSTIAEIDGLGQTTAKRLHRSATAVRDGKIVRSSDTPLPDGEPVYIDIETDGLNPTITWLVGVLDGSAAEGRYMPFLQTDPDDPGRAIADFMTWYTANASHRPLVAYNGWNFDFAVLSDHIVEYCPEYTDEWTSTYRFDPYQWAVDEGNAILPGQTNKLEDVAAALGYERREDGVTGAAVARTYRQWMGERTPETEPDWERFKHYCEDDVRALATVYEALDASGRIVSTETESENIDETTTQGSLSDW